LKISKKKELLKKRNFMLFIISVLLKQILSYYKMIFKTLQISTLQNK